MTRFLVGLLLGALLGIAGTAAFLIVYGGGDYLVSTSPKVRQLEGALSRSDEDREWLKARLRESTETTHRLESRFDALAARFERLGTEAGVPVPSATPGAKSARAAVDSLPPPDGPIPTIVPAEPQTDAP